MGGKVDKDSREKQNISKILDAVEGGIVEQTSQQQQNEQPTSAREFLKKIGKILNSKGKCSNDKQNNNNNRRGPGGGSAACAISLQENNNNAITVS